MQQQLQDLVVVITGASSGIGRATALAFARRGATVVAAARRAEALEMLAGECQQLGGRALAVPTDVRDQQAVGELARRVVEQFGRIDVWVNNAAVSLFGRFEEAPADVYRQVIETNLFGAIHGARAAMPIFRKQGRGVLINLASVVANAPQPYTSAYVISKHGIRALSMSLRQELMLDKATHIHVCTVMPATIDTPIFQNAANYTGRAVKPMPPVYPTDQVAQTIVALALKPRREVLVGGAGRIFSLFRTLAPGLAERIMAHNVDEQHLSQDEPAEPSPGNVLEPRPEWAQVSGGWLQPGSGRSRKIMAAAGLAALVPAVVLWRRRTAGQSRQPISNRRLANLRHALGLKERRNGRLANLRHALGLKERRNGRLANLRHALGLKESRMARSRRHARGLWKNLRAGGMRWLGLNGRRKRSLWQLLRPAATAGGLSLIRQALRSRMPATHGPRPSAQQPQPAYSHRAISGWLAGRRFPATRRSPNRAF